MQRRPLAQPGGIETIDCQRDQEPQVAAIEGNVSEDGETAATDDDENPGQRHADAAGLARRQPVAEQCEGPQRDEQRPYRLQQ